MRRMTDLADIDYFTDADIAQDPYAYWDYLRGEGPVVHDPVLTKPVGRKGPETHAPGIIAR